jgi:hypothetical protein
MMKKKMPEKEDDDQQREQKQHQWMKQNLHNMLPSMGTMDHFPLEYRASRGHRASRAQSEQRKGQRLSSSNSQQNATHHLAQRTHTNTRKKN